jgi:5'-methylthioadenosine phosphorylase
MLAILGGSGMTQLANLTQVRRQVIRTPYGEPSGALTFGVLKGREVVFLARHGYGHTIPPHAVNYRANIWALVSQGVKAIVSVASVGGIRADMGPGVLAVPAQIIDYTHGRKATFFDGADGIVKHIDFTHPYTPGLRRRILDACARCAEPVLDGGVYATVQGPRLETAAEIDRLERDGADMVGMTAMPEAALAREAGVDYAGLTVVVNWAAGRGNSADGISFEEIARVLEHSMARVRNVLEHVEVDDGSSSGS